MADGKSQHCTLQIVADNQTELKLALEGQLSVYTAGDIWQDCLALQKKSSAKQLIIDASQLSYCDGAGISLLIQLRDQQVQAAKQFNIEGLAAHFADLYDIIATLPKEPKQCPERHEFFSQVGHSALDVGIGLRDAVAFLGEFCYQAWLTLLHPRRMRWQELPRIIEEVGPNAFFIIALMGFLIGIVMAFEAAIQMETFGATIYVANLVGIALTRELGPLMTAILLTGRSASAFAAEIGTMKVNQEVDALHTMGLDPMLYLAMPRLFAVMLMTPVLYLEMILFGLLGGAVVMRVLDYSFAIYISQLKSAVHMSDFLGGLIKCEVFGIIIAAVGCMHGLRTKQGARSVGLSTTQSVVNGIILLIIFDGIFSVIYYALGI